VTGGARGGQLKRLVRSDRKAPDAPRGRAPARQWPDLTLARLEEETDSLTRNNPMFAAGGGASYQFLTAGLEGRDYATFRQSEPGAHRLGVKPKFVATGASEAVVGAFAAGSRVCPPRPGPLVNVGQTRRYTRRPVTKRC
jgi:hypothetical protein